MAHIANRKEDYVSTDKITRELLEQKFVIKLSTINCHDEGLQYESVLSRGTIIGVFTYLQQPEIKFVNEDCENLIPVLEYVADILESLLKPPANFIQELQLDMVHGYREWTINVQSEDL